MSQEFKVGDIVVLLNAPESHLHHRMNGEKFKITSLEYDGSTANPENAHYPIKSEDCVYVCNIIRRNTGVSEYYLRKSDIRKLTKLEKALK